MNTKILRQKILDLAIRGKLVPQAPNDEPASVLLEKIRAEKEQLIKEKKIKRDKNESVIFCDGKSYYEKFADNTVKCIDNDIPFEIPKGWEWCRLGLLCNYGICNSVNPSQIPDNAWILDLEDIEKETAKLRQRIRKKDRVTISTRHGFIAGNVLYSKLRTYLNKVLIADTDGFCTTEILPLDFKGFVVSEYAQRVLMSQMFLNYTAQCGYGVKMPRLGTSDGKKAFFPLPPLSEQNRIVFEIERLFALIDTIEENQCSLKQFIKQAKSKVLDLAMCGKLVPQDPNDEPASVLLGKIRKEHNGSKRRVESIADNSHYPELPKGWEYSNIGTVFKVTMGQSPEGNSVSGNSNGIEFHQGKIFFTDKYLSKSSSFTNNPTKVSEKESILLCVRAPVGIVNISRYEICIGRGLSAIKPFANMSVDFTFYLLKTLEKSFIEKSTGSTFQAISLDIIKDEIIPLPPLPEQQRIVAQIEQIFSQLDKIVQSIKA